MTPWTQVYSPVMGNIFISALVAALPVFVLLGFVTMLLFWREGASCPSAGSC